MKNNNTNKGITLIALVITIIVMLILVAVTISMAINGGLFQKAGEAVGDTQNKIDEEQTLASGKIQIDGVWYDSIDDYIADSKKDTNPGVLETIGTNKYEINSIEDLVALAYSVNSGEETYLGKTIELGKNLDFKSDSSYANPEAKYVLVAEGTTEKGYIPDETNGTSIKELLLGDNGFIPVGTNESSGFYGTIEGNYRIIKNMKITSITTYGGLIGETTVSQNTVIRNIGLEEFNIIKTTGACSGGILALARGYVEILNCYSTGMIDSSSYGTGGILGVSAGDVIITSCFNNSSVSGIARSGGILGYNYTYGNDGETSILNCYNLGNISNSGYSGGIAGGCFSGHFTNCYNAGSLEGSNAIGGIVAEAISNLTISNCYYMSSTATAGAGSGEYTGTATERGEADMQTDTFLEELKGSTDNTAWKRDDTKNNKMPILSWQ